jgi:hypothetical protein
MPDEVGDALGWQRVDDEDESSDIPSANRATPGGGAAAPDRTN